MFDKLVQVLVLGAAYERIADANCSATRIRNRRDQWIAAGVFAQLAQICLEAYDRIVGIDLGHVSVDRCVVKAPRWGKQRKVPGGPRQTGHQTVLAHRRARPTAGLRGRGRRLP